jgi:hypothetical protein
MKITQSLVKRFLDGGLPAREGLEGV